ncbi:hypothetical protein EV360DRAFT_76537 [Lentinula raphanica]|nr:hypothetical protein EV360DRAFT_76537 [Lentinula raphanica]
MTNEKRCGDRREAVQRLKGNGTTTIGKRCTDEQGTMQRTSGNGGLLDPEEKHKTQIDIVRSNRHHPMLVRQGTCRIVDQLSKTLTGERLDLRQFEWQSDETAGATVNSACAFPQNVAYLVQERPNNRIPIIGVKPTIDKKQTSEAANQNEDDLLPPSDSSPIVAALLVPPSRTNSTRIKTPTDSQEIVPDSEPSSIPVVTVERWSSIHVATLPKRITEQRVEPSVQTMEVDDEDDRPLVDEVESACKKAGIKNSVSVKQTPPPPSKISIAAGRRGPQLIL